MEIHLLVSPGSVCETLTYLVTRSAPLRVLLNCVMSGAASKERKKEDTHRFSHVKFTFIKNPLQGLMFCCKSDISVKS